MYKTLIIIHLLSLQEVIHSEMNVTVRTSKGTVVGLRQNPNLATGVSYDAFLGVPYGQIPARFQPPEPRSSWSSPVVTHSEGPACPQTERPFDEDCLYLNVFTPVNASLTPGLYSVMFFIHGSAFTAGSSSVSDYGPDFLVQRDVIIVAINYRMGATGFLTLGTPEAPGNLGIYDALLALQWVQEEIARFGGNPGQVTLFGHSSGSALAQFLYISPLSTGLFKYIICQSGSALSYDHSISAREAVHRSKLLGEAVGCDSAMSNSKLLTCLQRADINTIVREQNISLSTEVLASGISIRFRPVMDTLFGKPPFFTDSLENMIKKAIKNGRPMLTGFVPDEGIVMFREFGWRLVETNLNSFIPPDLQEGLTESQKASIVNKIRSKYFPETADQNKILDIMKIYSDTIFIYPTVEFTRHFTNVSYAYIFTYQGLWSPTPKYFSQFQMTGVNHGAELPYLFYNGQDLSPCTLNLPNLYLRDLMVNWWTTFAKTGKPDSSGEWQLLSDKGQYQLIDSSHSFVNSSDVEDRYYNFWASLDSSGGSIHLIPKMNLVHFTAVLFYFFHTTSLLVPLGFS